LNDLNLVTGNLIGSDLADINLSATVLDSSNPDVIEISLDGKMRIDTQSGQIAAKEMELSLQQAQQKLGVEIDDFTFNQSDSALQLTGLATSINVAMEGIPKVALESKLPSLSFKGATQEVAIDDFTVTGSLENREINFALPSLRVNMQAQTVSMESLTLQSEDLSLTLSDMKVNDLANAAMASGTIELPAFNAAQLIKDLGVDYQASDQTALNKLGFKTQFSGGTKGVGLTDMELIVDESQLAGSFSANIEEAPVIEFDMVLNQLDLDRYLPIASATEEASDVQTEGDVAEETSADAGSVPLDALKGINANGSFTAGKLVAGGVSLNDIDVQVVSSMGQLTITPKANLYDGTLAGDISFTESSEALSLKVNNQIKSVNLEKLLTAADVTDQLSGTGSLGIDLEISEIAGQQNRQGSVSILARDGAIKGVDIKAMIEKASSLFGSSDDDETDQSEVDGAGQEDDETRFAELTGTFNLNNNIISNNDFSMKAPLFRVNGEGSIDLASESLNYLVSVAVVNSSDGQGGESLEHLNGVTIPVRLSGAMTQPSYAIDMKELYKSMARKKIDEKKSQFLEEKLGIKGGEKLSSKGLLQSVLGGGGSDDGSSESAEEEDDPKKKLLKGLFK
jgi:AsmA protein